MLCMMHHRTTKQDCHHSMIVRMVRNKRSRPEWVPVENASKANTVNANTIKRPGSPFTTDEFIISSFALNPCTQPMSSNTAEVINAASVLTYLKSRYCQERSTGDSSRYREFKVVNVQNGREFSVSDEFTWISTFRLDDSRVWSENSDWFDR